MSVNALVTGLIVFRIFKVFRQVKPTSNEQALGSTGGRKLYSIISIIIESGMILFSIQLARFVVTVVQTNAADYAYQIIVCIHEILTVIITFRHLSLLLIILLILCWLQGHNTYNHSGAGVNGIVLQRRRDIDVRSYPNFTLWSSGWQFNFGNGGYQSGNKNWDFIEYRYPDSRGELTTWLTTCTFTWMEKKNLAMLPD